MTTEERLAEIHVKEYESRMKQLDELLSRAEARTSLGAAQREELAELRRQRDRLAAVLEHIRRSSIEEWARKGGPMILWDLVAERAEKLLERIEQQ